MLFVVHFVLFVSVLCLHTFKKRYFNLSLCSYWQNNAKNIRNILIKIFNCLFIKSKILNIKYNNEIAVKMLNLFLWTFLLFIIIIFFLLQTLSKAFVLNIIYCQQDTKKCLARIKESFFYYIYFCFEIFIYLLFL